jgi:multisubunit Na+/H+ antiporter MnhG subunit
VRIDIRLPIGLLFSVFGILLTAFGAFSGKDLYHRSLGINVNLWWGLPMLLFGVAMLLLAKKADSGKEGDSPSGRLVARASNVRG